MVQFNGLTFGTTIDRGKIYYFKSSKLINTNEPHYFIVIACPSDELIILTCCTTQFKKRSRFIELNKLPLATLVWIKPDEENCLQEDSYVNCNNCFQYSKSELIQIYEQHKIEFIGYISDGKLEEIRNGIIESPLIAQEIKEII